MRDIVNTEFGFSFLPTPWWATGMDGASYFYDNYQDRYKNLGTVNGFDFRKFGLTRSAYDELRVKYNIMDCSYAGATLWVVGIPTNE